MRNKYHMLLHAKDNVTDVMYNKRINRSRSIIDSIVKFYAEAFFLSNIVYLGRIIQN